MTGIYFGDFRAVVTQHIKAIDAQNPEFQSTEWFLLKYLRRIEKNADQSAAPGEMENSVRALIRFYVDTIDEHSQLGRQCIHVYEEYRKTLRTKREE